MCINLFIGRKSAVVCEVVPYVFEIKNVLGTSSWEVCGSYMNNPCYTATAQTNSN